MISKEKYLEKVAELKKQKKDYTFGPIILVAFFVFIAIDGVLSAISHSVVYVAWGVNITFVLFILCLFYYICNFIVNTFRKVWKRLSGQNKIYRLEGVKNIEKLEEEYKDPYESAFYKLCESVGFKTIPSSLFPLSESLFRRLKEQDLEDTFSYSELQEKAYSFGHFQFVYNNDPVLFYFHADMALPLKNEVFIGDFSNSPDLYPYKLKNGWNLFSENKGENFDWLTPALMDWMEKLRYVLYGDAEFVYLQITPKGIDGIIENSIFLYPSSFFNKFDKRGDFRFCSGYPSLYESACIMEDLNRFIDENKF